MSTPLPITLAKMEVADIPEVVEIDRLSFALPWSESSYRHELTQNDASHFVVALSPAPPRPKLIARLLGQPTGRRIIGYGGFWFVIDEVHINTLAVHPRWRGQGIGERLLTALLTEALELGAVEATLEVRAGNTVAQNLYRKYNFEVVGRRKHYYRDNQEDALLMTARLDEDCRNRILAGQNAALA
jgi:[ribosomal protein S18]-alanine N-acetyltransferase